MYQGVKLDSKIKVEGSMIGNLYGKMLHPALQIFDCWKGYIDHFWNEIKYKLIVTKISM